MSRAEKIVLHQSGGIVFRGPRGIVPYIAMWSDEQVPEPEVVHTEHGIAYADEHALDRDAHGLLWTRVTGRPGFGEPRYAQLHPLRQRRAMRRLLCQVCAAPADHTEQGTLWLSPDQRGEWPDWPDWPNHAHNRHPPVCLPCARMAVQTCPELRASHVAIRARSRVVGASGILHRGARRAGAVEVARYDTPAIRWLQADHLVRELIDSTIVPL